MIRRVPDANDVEAVGWAFDVLRRARPELGSRREPTECRCGWPDRSQLGNGPVRVPVLDMTAAPGIFALDNTPIRRTCRACTHPILPDRGCIAHRPDVGHIARNFYHPECVEIP